MSPPRGDHGFTLIEVLVAMVLSALIFGLTLGAFEAFQRSSASDIQRNEAQDSARTAIERLARQLRSAAAPTIGSFGALEQAEPYSIAFQTIDSSAPPAGTLNVNNAMRVRYCLNDSNTTNEVLWWQLKRWKTAEPEPKAAPSPASCPDLSAGDWESSQQLAQHLTNRNGGQRRPLFAYGPAGATTVANITTVEPHIYLDLNPGHSPGETQQTSTVSLRNANRQPVAAFTATEVNGHVRLNASASYDPDGLALNYEWLEGTTVLPTASQQYETPEALVSGTTHTFTLKVTDPGGLTNSASETVTIK